MFVEAIKKISEFTRPVYTIVRGYESERVMPGAATLFFVNEKAEAITCRHVVDTITQADRVNNSYQQFKKEREGLPTGARRKKKLRELEQKYGYGHDITIQIKPSFVDCVEKFESLEITPHPVFDIAIVKFIGYTKTFYKNHAVFLSDENMIQQGLPLCRLGYPFPEFSNFIYNEEKDDIEWTSNGQISTPRFPMDGIITRHLLLPTGEPVGIEMSTPGLTGQSGGPLFDEEGRIYGMQSMTNHLHLGFDIKEKEILTGGRVTTVSDHPFLHLGNCVRVNVIKSFLREQKIKFYEA
jgi:hypothetical protein